MTTKIAQSANPQAGSAVEPAGYAIQIGIDAQPDPKTTLIDYSGLDFKEMLAACPIDDIDLSRDDERPRSVSAVMFLADTNVVSELRRGRRGNPGVAAWFAGIAVSDLFISALVLGELRKGVAIARHRGDFVQAANLENWLRTFSLQFSGRILPVDASVAEVWGQMHEIRNVPTIDGLLAATAIVHELILVTRNIVHVQGLGADLLNPFSS